jgi:hypothetical protein
MGFVRSRAKNRQSHPSLVARRIYVARAAAPPAAVLVSFALTTPDFRCEGGRGKNLARAGAPNSRTHMSAEVIGIKKYLKYLVALNFSGRRVHQAPCLFRAGRAA